MRTNKFILLSLISMTALVSCGPKAIVTTQDELEGTVSYFINGNKLAMQAYPKDNYLFTGWFKKDSDNEFRFERASNPYIVEFKQDVTYQARFEPKSTQTFAFTLNTDFEGNMFYSISDFYGKDITDVIIPNTHYGFPVKEISKDTFANRSKIESIVIPKNIVTIKDGAFSGCTSLTNITIDHKISECDAAFTNWTAAQEIRVHESNFKSDAELWDWTIQKDSTQDFYTTPNKESGSDTVHIVKISE